MNGDPFGGPMDGSSPTSEAVSKRARYVFLRPITKQDYPKFFEWRVDAENLHLWTTRRRIPSYEQFAMEFEADLQATVVLLIVRRATGERIGFMQAYNLNHVDGWAYVLAYLVPEVRRALGYGAEAIMLFADYLFSSFPFRKLYADVYEYNEYVLRGLLKGGLREEGRSLRHLWYGDRYWDLVHLGYFREDWDSFKAHAYRILALEDELAGVLEEQAGPAGTDAEFHSST